MATNTTNFNLKKPAYTDTADIADINGNMDKVDASLNGLADAIAIVAKNNTHAAIMAGQYVYVHGHGTLAEGLYTAKSNIAANATLSTSNLQADGSGGLNALNSKLKEDVSNKISLSCTIATISSFSAYKTGSLVSISFIATVTEDIASGTEMIFTASYTDNNLKTIQRSQIGGSNQQWNKFLCTTTGNFSAVAMTNFSRTNAFWFTFQYVCNG